MQWTTLRFETFRQMVEWHMEHKDRYVIHVLSYTPSFILEYRERRTAKKESNNA
jgi:hypothetical protein